MSKWKFWGKKEEETPAIEETAEPVVSTPEPPVEEAAVEKPPAEVEPEAPIPEPPAAEEVAAEPEEPKKKGWFGGLRSGLKKTANLLNTDIRDLFKKEGRLIDEEFLREIFEILIKTDMGVQPATEIRDRIGKEFRGRVVHMEDVLDVVGKTLNELMDQSEEPIAFVESGPTVIMVVGVNGSGKTTSIAKLAYLFHSQGKKVVLGAGDTFRAAAVEQLTEWSRRIGCEIVTGPQGSDPASVAFKAVDQAVKSEADVCIVDTAGRLQTQANLMKELEKIRRVMGKVIEEAPHEVLLVLDATAGQNGVSQARGFSEAVECTGLVLAKLDGTAKGGVVVPIRQQFELPVKFIGLGEGLENLAAFESGSFVKALLAEGYES